MSIQEYRAFIAAKAAAVQPKGMEPRPMAGAMKHHQRASVDFALSRGSAALFLDTGLGKSFCELEWARQVAEETGKPALILTPLAVAGQMVREGQKFGIDARQIRDQSEVGAGIMVANYERLPHLAPSAFGGVVLDECFARGTPVSVLDHCGNVYQKNIETVRIGDSILNAAGVDLVSDVHRRAVPYAVRITVGSSVFVCSPNHPIFTERGWTPAQCLLPGDRALGTAAAVRLVRGDLLPEALRAGAGTILRAVLLSEMADATAGDCGEGALAGGRSETRREEVGVVSVGQSEGTGGDCADRCPEPGYSAGGSGEDLPPIESHEARTFRAWGQWDWADEAAIDLAGGTRRRLEGGISFVTGATDTGLSDALQARFGVAGEENRRRGGWFLPCEPEGSGREKGCEAAFARVDRLEVLEPGHPDLECLRDADGQLYFYDLGGTRHPSFTVCGLLVHNSSILKSFAGKTRGALLDAFSGTRFRLAATATPSPNDHMELGSGVAMSVLNSSLSTPLRRTRTCRTPRGRPVICSHSRRNEGRRMTADPHLMTKISTCTSTAELRGMLDALRARGVVLTDAQERAAQVKKAALLEDERARGWRR